MDRYEVHCVVNMSNSERIGGRLIAEIQGTLEVSIISALRIFSCCFLPGFYAAWLIVLLDS